MPQQITKIEYKDGRGVARDYTVGMDGVKYIKEHTAGGEGDKWFYDVMFENGLKSRLFTFDRVDFSDKVESTSF